MRKPEMLSSLLRTTSRVIGSTGDAIPSSLAKAAGSEIDLRADAGPVASASGQLDFERRIPVPAVVPPHVDCA